MRLQSLNPALIDLATRYARIVGRPFASVLEGFEIIEAVAAIRKDYQEKPAKVTTGVAPMQRHRNHSTIAAMREKIELHLRKNFGSNWFSKRNAGEVISPLGISPYDTDRFIDVAYRNQKLEKQTRGSRYVVYRFATINFADLDVPKS